MQTEEEFLKMIVQGIVHKPEEVSINKTVDEDGTVLSISVNKEDMGFVIGKRGANIEAIKHIVRAFGFKNEKKFGIKLLEPK